MATQHKGELLDSADMAKVFGRKRAAFQNWLRTGQCPVKPEKRVGGGPYTWRPIAVYTHLFGPPASYLDVERWVAKIRKGVAS